MIRIIALAILLFAGTAWAGEAIEMPIPGSPDFIVQEKARFEKDRLIRQWAASGEICRVLGHQWIYTPHIVSTFPEAVDAPKGYRDCAICGKSEKKYVTTKEEWR